MQNPVWAWFSLPTGCALAKEDLPTFFGDWGALMHDPVSTPDGYLFERAAIEVGGRTYRILWSTLARFFSQKVEQLTVYRSSKTRSKYGSDGWGYNTWDNLFLCLLALGMAGTASQPPSQNPQPHFLQILCTTTLSDVMKAGTTSWCFFHSKDSRNIRRICTQSLWSLEPPKLKVFKLPPSRVVPTELIGNSNLLVDGLLDVSQHPQLQKFPFILLTTSARTGPANMAPIPWRVPPWFGTCLTGEVCFAKGVSLSACWKMKGPGFCWKIFKEYWIWW